MQLTGWDNSSAAADEQADDLGRLHENENAYNRFKIRPRILSNVADVDPSTTLFGQKVRRGHVKCHVEVPR